MAANWVLKSLTDLPGIHKAIAKDLGVTNVWWRGHASAGWTLVPGVFRMEDGGGYRYESNTIRRFIQRARSRYPMCPDSSDESGWLFLMQHYGLPTRLLDWSESPLVALFFAVQGDGPGALFGLSPFALNKVEVGRPAIIGVGDPTFDDMISGAFGTNASNKSKAFAAAVIVDETDARMLAQLTAFTVHSSPRPLEEAPDHIRFLRRIEIPEKAKAELRWELGQMGVRRSTLFPDLHNLALELKERRYRNPGNEE
jgi:hypothetical protein